MSTDLLPAIRESIETVQDAMGTLADLVGRLPAASTKAADGKISTSLRIAPEDLKALKILAAERGVKVNDLILRQGRLSRGDPLLVWLSLLFRQNDSPGDQVHLSLGVFERAYKDGPVERQVRATPGASDAGRLLQRADFPREHVAACGAGHRPRVGVVEHGTLRFVPCTKGHEPGRRRSHSRAKSAAHRAGHPLL